MSADEEEYFAALDGETVAEAAVDEVAADVVDRSTGDGEAV